jgi:hypothetical protein
LNKNLKSGVFDLQSNSNEKISSQSYNIMSLGTPENLQNLKLMRKIENSNGKKLNQLVRSTENLL